MVEQELVKEYMETKNEMFMKEHQLTKHFLNEGKQPEEMQDLICADNDYIQLSVKHDDLENQIFEKLGMKNLRAIFGWCKMKCKVHNIDMGRVDITKGKRVVGTNYFCWEKDCTYEKDTTEKMQNVPNWHGK